MVVAGGGRKGKTIKCKIRYFVSALMVVVSHGHSEEPLYSFPLQQEFCGPVYYVANDYRKSLYYFNDDVQISVIYS